MPVVIFLSSLFWSTGTFSTLAALMFSQTAPSRLRWNRDKVLPFVPPDADPLLASDFAGIIPEFLGAVFAVTVKANFDIVYEVRSLVVSHSILLISVWASSSRRLDAEGHHLTTYLMPSATFVIRTNFNSTVNSGFRAGGAAGPSPYSLPWRKTGVRAIVNNVELFWSSSPTLPSAKLSGIAAPRSHWNRDKSYLRTTRWSLMGYSCSSNPIPSQSQVQAGARSNVALPFAIQANVELEDSGGSFDVILTSIFDARARESHSRDILWARCGLDTNHTM
ncbi:hypothetical protein GYMLUDRAFT_243539 [Collybiopsis luxurians FD-317 M1]|uniref:Uncharacterized protein n=1 Tax=Collybiopsis luxurians FD-317 M1 TaxID=944289 RepID=A0A0D0CYD1_9AGAR|nr:hypothetical protein GYMLUDRAFT_243539 [Collybiopsis luxurians FD-317 M1]